MAEESQDDDTDGVPARARKAGVTLIVWAVAAWLLIPVILMLSAPDANTPMLVGYLFAAGMALAALGGQALARRTRVRWWWGIFAVLASLVFFATWISVLMHSAELAPLNHGRRGWMPWFAGPLFGGLSALLGIRLLRSPQRRKLTSEQRAAIDEQLRRMRQDRALTFGWSMMTWPVIGLVAFAFVYQEEQAVLSTGLGLALIYSVVGYVLWARRRAVRVRQWLLVGSGLALLALLGWWLWRDGLAALQTGWFVGVGAAATYAVVTIVLGLAKAGGPKEVSASQGVSVPTSERGLS